MTLSDVALNRWKAAIAKVLRPMSYDQQPKKQNLPPRALTRREAKLVAKTTGMTLQQVRDNEQEHLAEWRKRAQGAFKPEGFVPKSSDPESAYGPFIRPLPAVDAPMFDVDAEPAPAGMVYGEVTIKV